MLGQNYKPPFLISQTWYFMSIIKASSYNHKVFVSLCYILTGLEPITFQL